MRLEATPEGPEKQLIKADAEEQLINADRVVKFMRTHPMWMDEATIKAKADVEDLFATLHFAKACLGKRFGYQMKRVGGIIYFRIWTGHAAPPAEELTLWAKSSRQTAH